MFMWSFEALNSGLNQEPQIVGASTLEGLRAESFQGGPAAVSDPHRLLRRGLRADFILPRGLRNFNPMSSPSG